MTSPSGVVFYMQYYSPTGKTLYGTDKTAENGELLTWNSPGRFALDESYASTMTRNEPVTVSAVSATSNTLTLTLAAYQNQTTVANLQTPTAKSSILNDARQLIRLREELSTEEDRLAKQRLELARRYYSEQDTERIEVPRDEFASWIKKESPADESP